MKIWLIHRLELRIKDNILVFRPKKVYEIDETMGKMMVKTGNAAEYLQYSKGELK